MGCVAYCAENITSWHETVELAVRVNPGFYLEIVYCTVSLFSVTDSNDRVFSEIWSLSGS